MVQPPQLELLEHPDLGVDGVVQSPLEHEPDSGVVTLVLALGPTGCKGFASGSSSSASVGVGDWATSDTATSAGAASTIIEAADGDSESTYRRTAPMPMMGTAMASIRATLAVLECNSPPRDADATVVRAYGGVRQVCPSAGCCSLSGGAPTRCATCGYAGGFGAVAHYFVCTFPAA